jgi:AmmeMemoRadiSam system protein A
VTQDELKDLKVAVSILTHPKKIDFSDEDDLLNKMIPNKDGIIIRDGEYQAVYLPSVWEQLPDKKEFLNSLKQKAGLQADYFSDTFEAYWFETTYIKEE